MNSFTNISNFNIPVTKLHLYSKKKSSEIENIPVIKEIVDFEDKDSVDNSQDLKQFEYIKCS